MLRAPQDATCAVHPDEPAPTVCERCGIFMCRECSARYAEDRCPKCRPKYAGPELIERRLNRVRKVAWLRCDVCDLEGPRFDRVEPIALRTLFFAPLLAFATFGLLGVLYVLMALDSTQPICPGCERSDGLEPSLKEDLPRPPGWDELRRQGRSTKLRNAATLLLTLALVTAATLGAFSAWR